MEFVIVANFSFLRIFRAVGIVHPDLSKDLVSRFARHNARIGKLSPDNGLDILTFNEADDEAFDDTVHRVVVNCPDTHIVSLSRRIPFDIFCEASNLAYSILIEVSRSAFCMFSEANF